MPFHTNPEDRSLMLEFGFGDLCIANAGILPEAPDELIIYSDPDRHEIGQVNESHNGLGTDEIHTLHSHITKPGGHVVIGGDALTMQPRKKLFRASDDIENVIVGLSRLTQPGSKFY